MIQQIVKDVNALDRFSMDKKELSVMVEINQRWIEYLDELETADLQIDDGSVTVRTEGKVIKFRSIEDVATWITSIK